MSELYKTKEQVSAEIKAKVQELNELLSEAALAES
jgi:flagellar hook-associated protein FlgK